MINSSSSVESINEMGLVNREKGSHLADFKHKMILGKYFDVAIKLEKNKVT